MIEQVAQAIYDDLNGGDGSVYERIPMDECRRAAVAAIVAMRDADEPMLAAAATWSRRAYGAPIDDADAKGCWQAMSHGALLS